MARWRGEERFPGPLAEFRAEDWPPVEGECLGGYACRGVGYGADCVPRPGEVCGQAFYAMLGREHPDRPDIRAAALAADAYERFHQARLAWIGEGGPGYLDEFIEGCRRHHEIRYAPYRDRPAVLSSLRRKGGTMEASTEVGGPAVFQSGRAPGMTGGATWHRTMASTGWSPSLGGVSRLARAHRVRRLCRPARAPGRISPG